MKKKAGPAVIAVALIVLTAIAGIVWKIADRYIPSKEVLSAEEYFGISEEQKAAVILEDHIEETAARLDGERPYVAYEIVRDSLNDHFFLDAEENQIILTTAAEIIKIQIGGMAYTTQEGSGAVPYQIAFRKDDTLYLSLDFVQQYTNLDYTVIEGTPSRILIKNQWKTKTYAEMAQEEAIRLEDGIKSPILKKAAEGETVTVLDQMEDWSQILTADGYIGYVRNQRLKDVYEKEETRSFEETEYTSLHKEEDIRLIWHQVTSQESNEAFETDMQNVTGINTVSPTWFSISSNDGEITSLADAGYAARAHEKGMEVWGLLDNFNPEISTYEIVSHTASREHLENRLIEEAQACQMDGINIDIEALLEEASEGYIQFMRELSVKCRNAGLVLSVDVPPPYEFNAHYNRAALGEVVDYVIVMGYDEHYVGSEPGSVASLPYERNGITGTLEEVPKEKIISGIPFYTRLWRTDASGEVSSEAIGMNRADEILAEHQVTPNWSEECAQEYAEFQDADGNFCQIWLENEKSIEQKMKLVQEYELAGTAIWKLGFERDSIWNTILLK